MFAPANRRGHLLIAASLLLISVLVEQYCIAPLFPMISDAGSLRPMLVFLDIPLALPAIDLLPVSILFTVLYAIVIDPVLAQGDQHKRLGVTVWKALSGWWILLICIAAGGGLYYLLQDYLPRQVANGIDSFGVRTDLTLPWPAHRFLHLHGSMFQFVFAALGLHILAKRTVIAQPVVNATVVPVAPATVVSESAVAEARAILSSPRPPAKSQVPAREPVPPPPPRRPAQPKPQPQPTRATPVFPDDPPTCRLTTPPPIAVVIPRPAPGIGKMQPCIVTGAIKPARATHQTQVLYERPNVHSDGVMA